MRCCVERLTPRVDRCFGRAKAVYGMELRRDDIIIQFDYGSLQAYAEPVNGDIWHPDVYKTLEWNYRSEDGQFIVGNSHPTWVAGSSVRGGQMALRVWMKIYVRCSQPPCMRTRTRLLAFLTHA